MPKKINLDLAHCTILWGSRNPSLELEPFFFHISHHTNQFASVGSWWKTAHNA